jgi:hypothetical protein
MWCSENVGLHRWSKWKTYKWVGTSYGTAGYLVTGDTSPRQISETKQARVCSACGIEQHRRVANANGGTYE